MILSVVGARPNFVKMAPILKALKRRKIGHRLVHTGQHYDVRMSDLFFKDLEMPKPDICLGVGQGSPLMQTARILEAFEKQCLELKPRLVLVSGDVNSTLAAALAAAKSGIPVAHVESGLRSFDRTMPEEMNRMMTDHLSELLFVTEPSGRENLLREGVDEFRQHLVGNTMIDTLLEYRDRAVSKKTWQRYGLEAGAYGLVTLHRPSNVDDPVMLERLGSILREYGRTLPLLFPVHPRTRKNMESAGISWDPLNLVEPVGYLEFLGLMSQAKIIFTDSGGIQEESTALRVPCLTLRENTERPVTLTQGTNRLAGMDGKTIQKAYEDLMSRDFTGLAPVPLWDGNAAERIVGVISKWLAGAAA